MVVIKRNGRKSGGMEECGMENERKVKRAGVEGKVGVKKG